jgi:alpha-glucosidase
VLADRRVTHTWIEGETTEFAFGPGGTHWGQSYDPPNAWQPAYEAPYTRGMPVGSKADGPGWGIPALLKDENGIWVLLHESGLTRSYHGSHLASEAPGGTYRIAGPLASDGLGFGDIRAATTTPAALPWRFMVISQRLGDIVESNRVFDLAPPSAVADISWIEPGVSSWSWQSDHDSSRDLGKLKSFIDLAAELGWRYSLVDANWNRIAPDAMEQLVAYADARKVGLLFWYNSGGRHNAVTEEPRGLMDERARRRAEFARIAKLGVKGVKIDFFQSDKQERIEQYLDILEDAAEFHLLVNFHGCTIPRGWQRTYPNLMTMEAVRGGEHYSFDSLPNFAELSTYQDSVLPFTRNVIGSMDFTPVLFSPQARARLTSNAHEAALAVVFESGVQHMADSIAGYRSTSAEYRTYFRELPTAWDETRFLVGAPGEGIVLARRSGARWYVAGVTAAATPSTVRVDLRFLRGPSQALVISDTDGAKAFDARRQAIRPDVQTIQLAPYGGFVMVIDQAPQR